MVYRRCGEFSEWEDDQCLFCGKSHYDFRGYALLVFSIALLLGLVKWLLF